MEGDTHGNERPLCLLSIFSITYVKQKYNNFIQNYI